MIELLLTEIKLHNERNDQSFKIYVPKCLESLLDDLPHFCFIPDTGRYKFYGFDIVVLSE